MSNYIDNWHRKILLNAFADICCRQIMKVIFTIYKIQLLK